MGFKLLDLRLPTDFTPDQLKKKITKKLNVKNFSHTIEKQSLDARKKGNIHWNVRVGVSSPALRAAGPKPVGPFSIPYK
ncbi:MAG: hypothetical protein GY950_13775, partial [bacterium]|nr:hypothetical protein [bacterium]